MAEAAWYVVHTYSGYENKVKVNLEKAVINNNMQDLIREVKVPMEEVTEIRNGKRVSVPRKIYPGYVLVNMVKTDRSWYIVRNTRGVTGFVGPDSSEPIPLTEEEFQDIEKAGTPVRIDISIGESVCIIEGPFENFVGVVRDIDSVREKLRVTVSMFGRETPVDLDFVQVKKV